MELRAADVPSFTKVATHRNIVKADLGSTLAAGEPSFARPKGAGVVTSARPWPWSTARNRGRDKGGVRCARPEEYGVRARVELWQPCQYFAVPSPPFVAHPLGNVTGRLTNPVKR